MHDELLLNTLHPIEERTFVNLLVKAIKIHRIALTKYKDELICKYYKKEYNIFRNDSISIGHILALIIYTDCSQLCTAFRQTYRRIDGETTSEQVEARHQQFYHLGRLLFEAVEFYGTRMRHNLTVYHGLSTVLHFGQFTAYFNQPISTTTDITTAHQFSQSTGIILALKTSTNHKHSDNRIPKYLGVSWFSSFPNEDEKLFYGLYVRFKISDIIMGSNLQQHVTELSALNRIQQILTNFKVEWNLQNERDQAMIRMLAAMIISQQENKQNDKSKHSKYAWELFDYFCKHKDRHQIIIQNFMSLPPDLYHALFIQNTNQLSFIPISQVFPFMLELTLNELEIGHLSKFYDSIGLIK